MIIRILLVILLAPVHSLADTVRVLVSDTLHRSGIVQAIAPGNTRLSSTVQSQVLQQASECSVDVVAVSNPLDHTSFIEQGYGLYAAPGLVSDFVLVGPADAPDGIALALTLEDAIRLVPGFDFESKGDEASLRLTGIHQLLNRPLVQNSEYRLTHRADWLAGPKAQPVLYEHSPLLSIEYLWIPVATEKCPDANTDGAVAWIESMTESTAAEAVRAFKIQGQSPFVLP